MPSFPCIHCWSSRASGVSFVFPYTPKKPKKGHTKILCHVHHVDCGADLEVFPIGQVPKYRFLLPHGCASVSVIRNRLSTRTLYKDHLQILDHIMYISTSTVARLRPVIHLTFEMLVFLSYGMPARKKSTMSQV